MTGAVTNFRVFSLRFHPVLSADSWADSVICVRSFQETGLVYVGNIARETAVNLGVPRTAQKKLDQRNAAGASAWANYQLNYPEHGTPLV